MNDNRRKLIAALRAEQLPLRWNFAHFLRQERTLSHACHTSGCALGLATLLFPGQLFDRNRTAEDNWEVTPATRGRPYIDDLDTVAKFFDLRDTDVVEFLYSPIGYGKIAGDVTPTMVADALERAPGRNTKE